MSSSFRLIYYFFYLLLVGVALFISPFSKKIRLGLFGRWGAVKRLRDHGPWNGTLWIHVASAGELEQAIPLLDEFRRKMPDRSLFLSFFSPSALSGIEAESKRRAGKQPLPWDHADFSPLDLPWCVSSFFKVLNPSAYICINREIWPESLIQSRRRKVPAYLWNVFLPKSVWPRFRFLLPWVRFFEEIGTVDKESADFFNKELPSVRCRVVGDTRVERVIQRRKLQKTPPAWRDFFSGLVFVGASIWREDFRALKPSLMTLHRLGWRLILVPHEPEESFFNEIKAWGKENQMGFRLWSSWLRQPDLHSPLIVDGVGFLAELYDISSLVFVGGSFKGRIHNVLEPAAYGKAILTGPHVWNSAHATQWEGKGLKRCRDSDELLLVTKELVTHPSLREEWGKKIKNELQEGVSEKYIGAISFT